MSDSCQCAECVPGTMPEPLTDRALHEIAARLRPATQHEAWVLAKHAARGRGVNGKMGRNADKESDG